MKRSDSSGADSASKADNKRMIQFNRRLDSWINEHGETLRQFLFAKVRNPDTVEDLLQEVFLRARSDSHNYKEQGKSKRYLIRIAQRLANENFRKAKREKQMSELQWEVFEPTSIDHHEKRMEDGESRSILMRSIRKLPPVQRKVVYLRYFLEYDFNTIAMILGCPRNTAFSHAHRALQRLKTMLDSEEKRPESGFTGYSS